MQDGSGYACPLGNSLLSVACKQDGQLQVGLEFWAGNCQSPVLKVGSDLAGSWAGSPTVTLVALNRGAASKLGAQNSRVSPSMEVVWHFSSNLDRDS